jgi:precorrin-6B C5,15-methyltransferase / cobalt-precorrin-6B C5,C15-methyltransferase
MPASPREPIGWCVVAESPLSVIGMHGGEVFGAAARDALGSADVIIGSTRHLGQISSTEARRQPWSGSIADLLRDLAMQRAAGHRVALLASGDPGFFGIVRALRTAIPAEQLCIYPAPSSIALAAAKVGMSWEDLTVVSAHGRPLADAAAMVARSGRVAVLTAPDTPPEALGRALVELGTSFGEVYVCSQLGSADEAIIRTDVTGLASGTFDGLSVVILLRAPAAASPSITWGRSPDQFDHRAGMITKPEVRVVALARLNLPTHGVLWDIGAGSGSVAIEAKSLAPSLRVIAIEHNGADAARIRSNAAELAVEIEVVEGRLLDVLADLPSPDRVFVGGGGIEALDAALARLRPGGAVVATFAAMDRAVVAHARLGNLVQIAVSTAVALPGQGGLRLVAENPVFVAWGPSL